MPVAIEETICKSALTGSGGSFRLNPYVGCEHACEYCYATYIARWRGQSGPWGSWVQVKTNIADVLAKELARRKVAHVFLSTVCDVYQPVERQYELTRRCLVALRQVAVLDPDLEVFLLTKSDLVTRDLDLLTDFPEGSLRVGLSITSHRDEVAALVEPAASPPSRRLAAAAELKQAGVTAGLAINPMLPYITERDLPALLDAAEQAELDFVGFDSLHYLRQHVGGKMRRLYEQLGPEASARLAHAREDPAHEDELRALIDRTAAGRAFEISHRF